MPTRSPLRILLHILILLTCLIPLFLNLQAIYTLFYPLPIPPFIGPDPALQTPILLLGNHTTTDFPEETWTHNTAHYLPSFRSEVYQHGARVACWPSSGGIWIKHADLVDLNYLGLDRQYDTPRQHDQALEDEFCAKLRRVGAERWESRPITERWNYGWSSEFEYSCKTLERCFEPSIPNEYLIAWPEEGQAACTVSKWSFVDQLDDRKAWNVYHNAMDMNERCNGILALGGKVCRCKEECPELAHLDWGRSDRGGWGCNDPGWHDIEIGGSGAVV